MTPEQFLSLDVIKAKCGISGTDLDAQLGIYRDAAIGAIESRTRRNIVDRTEHGALRVKSPDRPQGLSFITFHVYDAKPITEAKNVLYRTAQDSPGFTLDGRLAIPANYWEVRADRVCVYNADSGGVQAWPDRDTSHHFAADLDVGIADGKAPAEFTAAALMLVREMHEGSPLDALPHSILDLVLADHVKPALTATDELLMQAGVE